MTKRIPLRKERRNPQKRAEMRKKYCVSVARIASSGRWRAVSCVRVGSTFAVCDLKRTLIC